jgi:hypothetical protein
LDVCFWQPKADAGISNLYQEKVHTIAEPPLDYAGAHLTCQNRLRVVEDRFSDEQGPLAIYRVGHERSKRTHSRCIPEIRMGQHPEIIAEVWFTIGNTPQSFNTITDKAG